MQDEVDSDKGAYIPQVEMDSVESTLTRQFFTLDELADDINGVLDGISDLGSFIRISTEKLENVDAGSKSMANSALCMRDDYLLCQTILSLSFT
ncbi:hypothetical protein [Anaerosporobacter sp.]